MLYSCFRFYCTPVTDFTAFSDSVDRTLRFASGSDAYFPKSGAFTFPISAESLFSEICGNKVAAYNGSAGRRPAMLFAPLGYALLCYEQGLPIPFANNLNCSIFGGNHCSILYVNLHQYLDDIADDCLHFNSSKFDWGFPTANMEDSLLFHFNSSKFDWG